MRDMAHSICLIKLYLVTMRQKFRFLFLTTLSQFDNKKPEELESEFDHFDVDNWYLASPFKGPNIMDLDFVYKQSLDRHKVCKTTLSLT